MADEAVFFTLYAGFGINPALVSDIFLNYEENNAHFVFFGSEDTGLIVYYQGKEQMDRSIDSFVKLHKKRKFKIVKGKEDDKGRVTEKD